MTPFIAGLDLGQQQDPSVIAAAEVKDRAFAVRHLHRWELGTSYPRIIDDIARLYSRPPLAGSTLVLDATGVGRPVLDGLHAKRIAARLVPVIITSGFATSRTRGCFTVPKSDLVGALRMVLGQGRLKISQKLALAKAAQRELENFTLKVSDKGLETFGNADKATHDDLVIALALMAWYGQRRQLRDPLRILHFTPNKHSMGRHIIVAGKEDADFLPLDSDIATLAISLTNPPCWPASKLLGRHGILCSDSQPAEISTPWTVEQQEGLLSPEQAKQLWAFLLAPDLCKWRCLVVIDEGGQDRRGLSLAQAVCDSYSMPRTSILVHGADPEEESPAEDDPPNEHLYQTAKRGRYSVAG